jgi:transposase
MRVPMSMRNVVGGVHDKEGVRSSAGVAANTRRDDAQRLLALALGNDSWKLSTTVPTNNRLFVDAIMRMARTGTPWRDLSPSFGKWNSVWKRFRRWARAGCGSAFWLQGQISNPSSSMEPSSGAHQHSWRKRGIQEQRSAVRGRRASFRSTA